MNAELATLLVSCADRRGIVAALAQMLYGHGANILDSDQHTDPVLQKFFQRIRFDLSELQTDRGTLERAIAEVAQRFSLNYRLLYAERPKKVALFVSKHEHCLYDLLLRHRAGELSCEIPLIIANHPDMERAAREFGIEFQVIEKTAANKAAAEEAERKLLRERGIDLVVLARYMQILGQSFVEEWQGRVINIHHSFLPAFVGGRPYHQAHERGVKLIGATAHYATAVLDEGPIIEQDVARVSHRDQIEDLVAKGRDVEKVVLSRAVRWHLDHRVLVSAHKTIVFD
jgi:formyltetrahydrofolate deformylase